MAFLGISILEIQLILIFDLRLQVELPVIYVMEFDLSYQLIERENLRTLNCLYNSRATYMPFYIF